MSYDIAIVGAGIVGLASAYKLHRAYPDARILILEKEPHVAAHQTGRNSGVVHSGIYYTPGSYRARTCVDGRRQLERFVAEHGIAYEQSGKVIVATREKQLPRMERIYRNGIANGVEDVAIIDAKELSELEPHARGLGAIHVPCTGIVDYRAVSRKLVELMEPQRVELKTSQTVRRIARRNNTLDIVTDRDRFRAAHLINCAGLYSDRVAASAGLRPDIRIVPFRGEFFRLKPHAERLVNGLIYPMPNPDFPFLGVHFTRRALGGVECGPNAVLALKREGYHKHSFNLREAAESVGYRGIRKLAVAHWRMSLDEIYRSISKAAFVRDLQELVPVVRPADLQPAPAGVRAMAVDRSGGMLDDFDFATTERQIHVLNAPSPAATAGLAIGDEILARARRIFGL